jgi:hypothetical protein
VAQGAGCELWLAGTGRDFIRQNNFHPAGCQRINVAGRTATKASRQLKSRDSNASAIRVAYYEQMVLLM